MSSDKTGIDSANEHFNIHGKDLTVAMSSTPSTGMAINKRRTTAEMRVRLPVQVYKYLYRCINTCITWADDCQIEQKVSQWTTPTHCRIPIITIHNVTYVAVISNHLRQLHGDSNLSISTICILTFTLIHDLSNRFQSLSIEMPRIFQVIPEQYHTQSPI